MDPDPESRLLTDFDNSSIRFCLTLKGDCLESWKLMLAVGEL